jgi:hypothetical protein
MRGCVSPRQVPFGRSPQWLSRRTPRGREAKPKWTVTDLLLRQAQAGRARRSRRDPLQPSDSSRSQNGQRLRSRRSCDGGTSTAALELAVSTVTRAKSFVRSAPLSCATRKLSASRSSSLSPRRLRPRCTAIQNEPQNDIQPDDRHSSFSASSRNSSGMECEIPNTTEAYPTASMLR